MGLHLVPDAAELRAARATSTASRSPTRGSPQSAARWARAVHAGHARHRRRGPPPRRGARLGRGLRAGLRHAPRAGCCCRARRSARTPAPIPGVRYDGDGVAVARRRLHATPTRCATASAGRSRSSPTTACCSGVAATSRSRRRFDDALHRRARPRRRYRTAICAELADGLPRILAAAHAKLLEARAGGHRDAGGLVVAADSEHARAVAKVLREVTGKAPTVVLHTEARARREARGVHRSRATRGSSR